MNNNVMNVKIKSKIKLFMAAILEFFVMTTLPQFIEAKISDRAKKSKVFKHEVEACFGPYSAVYPSEYYLHLQQIMGNNKKEILKVEAASFVTKCVKVEATAEDVFVMEISSQIPGRVRTSGCEEIGRSKPASKVVFAIADVNVAQKSFEFKKIVGFIDENYRVFFVPSCMFKWE